MINTFLYACFVIAWARTLLTGKRTILYASAFLLPVVQVLPAPVPTVSTTLNLMFLGLVGSLLIYPTERRPLAQPLPLKRSILVLVAMLLLGLSIRGIGELLGGQYLLKFADAAKNTYYWVSVFLLYVLFFRSQGSRFNPLLAIRAVMLSALMESCISILERVGGTGRGSAHFGEPNLAGAYYSAASAFYLAWFLMTKDRLRWFYFAAWFLTLGGLFSTLSRGGMIASALANTLVVLVFYFFVGKRAGTKVFFTLLLALLVANLSLLIPQSVKERVMFTFGHEAETADATEPGLDDSTEERLFYVRAAWDLFQERPFGSGAFTFPQRVSLYHGKAKQSHNIYLQVLVEFGVQGFLALVAFVFVTFGFLWRRFRKDTDPLRSTLALGLLGWWTGLVVAHIFLNSLLLPEIVGQFLLLLGCLIPSSQGAGQASQEADDGPRSGRRRPRVLRPRKVSG